MVVNFQQMELASTFKHLCPSQMHNNNFISKRCSTLDHLNFFEKSLN